MFRNLLSNLPAERKSKLRGVYYKKKEQLIQAFLSYGPAELKSCIETLGIQKGDTILLHSSFRPTSGFQGSPETVIDVFLGAIGDAGNLLMVSLPYLSSSHEYLQKLKCFDVRNTMSQMGLISEMFRRRKNVLRSLHPTHPVLACGPKAEWIVGQHEESLYPCGRGTPFEKLALLNGKVFFFDAPFASFTFFHYLEDLVQDKLTFPLYVEHPFEVPVIDRDGNHAIVRTYVFSPDAIRRRRFNRLEAELLRRRSIRKAKVGNTQVLSVETRDAIACTEDMTRRGDFFYEM